jgi:hypothetical protein
MIDNTNIRVCFAEIFDSLPVDGALFLEFLPSASGGLLTLLSVWWPVGQLIGSLSRLPVWFRTLGI